MNLYAKVILTSLLSLGALAGMAEEKMDISYLGPNNTLVRISETDSNFLLLPVQESQPISHIRVVADNNLAETFNIALANGKVDYYVPVDLRKWKGKNLVFDVRTNNDRNNIRDVSNAVWVKELELANDFDVKNKEEFRPSFHHTPAYGWMNDPNGMFYKDGRWHLYYQWNPYGSKWENMTWGHSSSTDLVNWEAEPVAIKPNALGTIFSGSSVVDKNNTAGFGENAIIAFYTSAGASQMQSMAYSTDDGQTFTEYTGNPVLTYESESRDPNIFWDAEHNQWVMELVAALEHKVLFYTSPDLKNWTLASKFGDHGSNAGVWECPDLLHVPVEGTGEKKWVLIVNINPGGPFGGSAAQYFVGNFDGQTFTCDSAPEVTKWMDYGKDHYATVSFSNAPDDRTTVLAWMSNWEYANDVPTMQFRSANSLPRDLYLFKAPDGEYYLASTPSPEVKALRGKERKFNIGSLSGSSRNINLPVENGGICEIVFNATVPSGRNLNLTLSNNKGEKVVMTLDGTAKTFSMDRNDAGVDDFSENFPGVTTGPIYPADDTYEVRLFVDRSSIEAFIDGGRLSMTNLVFPTEPYTSLSLSSKGGKVKCSPVQVYPMKPAHNPDKIK